MTSTRSSMLRGTVYSLASLVVTRAITVVNSVVVTRFLGGENLGILSVQNTLLAVVAILATCGIPAAAVKFIAEEGAGNAKSLGEIVSSGLLITVFAASIASVAVVVLAPFLAESVFGEGRLSSLLVIGAVGLLLASVPGPAFALLQGLKRFRDMNLQIILVAISSVPITIVLVSVYDLVGAATAVVAVGLVSLAVNLRLLRRIQRQLGLRWQPPRLSLSRRLLKYGTGTVLSGLVAMPALLFSYALLASTQSFEAMGHYSVAFALASYLAFIPLSVGVPMVPTVSELSVRSAESVSSLLVKTIRLVSYIALPISMALILFSRPIVSILYGEEFLPSSDLLRLTAAAAYFIAVTSIVGFAIAGTARVWHGLGLNALWGAFYTAASLLLIPSYGALGLAAGLLASYVLHAITVLVYSKWAFAIRPSGLAAPLMVASVALPAAFAVTTIPIAPIAWVAIPSLLCFVVIVEWIFLWPSERDLLKGAVRKGTRLIAAVRLR